MALSSLLLLGGTLAIWSWLTWPDLLIDFGREAYVAWRLSEGDTLYRDIAYHNGPLSPYWNALVMEFTGRGIQGLFLGNALVLAALVWAIHARLRALSDDSTAWAAVAFFLLVFGFGRYAEIGNYTYLAPYSHEITHGLALALAALICAARVQQTTFDGAQSKRAWTLAAGLLLGAVALTKVELFVALLPALALALVLEPARERRSGIRLAGSPLLLAMGAGVALVLAAWALLVVATPLSGSGARAGLFEGFAGALDSRLTELPFYQWGAGVDDVLGNFIHLFNSLGFELALLVPGLAAAHWLAGRPTRGLWIAATLPAFILLLLRDQVAWLEAARPLPFYLVCIALWRGMPLVQREASPKDRARAAAELPLIVFALLLLAKLGLNARVYHYGFVLAMPATLVVVLALLAWIPRWLDAGGRNGDVFRALSAAILTATALAHLELGTRLLPELNGPLGQGHDRILGDTKIAPVLASVLEQVELELGSEGTLLVLPEGVMLNYLGQRRTPTRFLNFTPFDVIVWGEDAMLEALRAAPPDAVVVVQRDTGEYGASVFGRDYASELASWLRANHRRSWQSEANGARAKGSFHAELWLARRPPSTR
jgi:4-amino-4-deoxy-L-arabinose transferase-like glycosyltransferase